MCNSIHAACKYTEKSSYVECLKDALYFTCSHCLIQLAHGWLWQNVLCNIHVPMHQEISNCLVVLILLSRRTIFSYFNLKANVFLLISFWRADENRNDSIRKFLFILNISLCSIVLKVQIYTVLGDIFVLLCLILFLEYICPLRFKRY